MGIEEHATRRATPFSVQCFKRILYTVIRICPITDTNFASKSESLFASPCWRTCAHFGYINTKSVLACNRKFGTAYVRHCKLVPTKIEHVAKTMRSKSEPLFEQSVHTSRYLKTGCIVWIVEPTFPRVHYSLSHVVKLNFRINKANRYTEVRTKFLYLVLSASVSNSLPFFPFRSKKRFEWVSNIYFLSFNYVSCKTTYVCLLKPNHCMYADFTKTFILFWLAFDARDCGLDSHAVRKSPSLV